MSNIHYVNQITTLNLKKKLITVILQYLVWKLALYQIYKNYPGGGWGISTLQIILGFFYWFHFLFFFCIFCIFLDFRIFWIVVYLVLVFLVVFFGFFSKLPRLLLETQKGLQLAKQRKKLFVLPEEHRKPWPNAEALGRS